MSKKVKKQTKRQSYLSAAKLDILPVERKALIAFATAPALGRIVAVNGHAHYYDQGDADNHEAAHTNECGTAGCVAGFVYAHATIVQKVQPRSARNSSQYISSIGSDEDCEGNEVPVAEVLEDLYGEARPYTLETARKTVDTMLRTGKVVWPVPDGVPVP